MADEILKGPEMSQVVTFLTLLSFVREPHCSLRLFPVLKHSSVMSTLDRRATNFVVAAVCLLLCCCFGGWEGGGVETLSLYLSGVQWRNKSNNGG